MMLPDHEILSEILSGRLGIDPFIPGNVQPASLDVTIGPDILIPGRKNRMISHSLPRAIQVGEFALASTVETVTIPNDLCARLEGRSSWGRLGLVVHVTAGFIDPGFHGQVTLELKNVGSSPIHVAPGDRIGQLSFTRLASPCRNPYGGNYQGQAGPTPSVLQVVPVEARLTEAEEVLRARVKAVMVADRLSIKDVVTATQATYGSVYRLLTGTGGPSPESFQAIVNWLSVQEYEEGK